ncbi:hypothetical protein VIN01S_10000 [Vibrio inusitatus NBRC 102082]|uniref:Lipoprotein n=1 Tax=Vibrio inusitatus NBRC 102082 TaxID=1219070 RepID=A0A4Y3HSY1_9VIBR|nr:hypothetical protein [Vibrio inusitatus]GEA50196.1 hypothetical protein VIN01S_10000 [Vibrio inusitatus NBRC 102082]
MKASKTAIAVAISSAFLFGCDFDIGDENNEITPPPEVTPPPSEVYSIENVYWDMVSDTTALSLSGTQPYLFANDEEGTRALSIYTGDVANGYTFESSSYSADEEGSVSFDGNQCTYTVANSELDMSCTKDGVATTYSATEIEDEDVITALENATDGKPTTVEEVNAAIASAQDGDIIGLSASGTFNTGVIELNKAVTLDGAGLATVIGDACIDVTAAGAAIKGITFANTNLAGCFGRESAGTSDNETGAIVIGKIGKDSDPVVLENLKFDANDITEDDLGTKKASWLFSRGYFTLDDSEFVGLSGSFQNNAIRINCSSDNGRFGSAITNNTFTINAGGSDVGGIKVGDSSSAIIKPSEDNLTCNVTIESNTFIGYKTLLSAENTSDIRNTAIYAQPSAVNTASGKENILE